MNRYLKISLIIITLLLAFIPLGLAQTKPPIIPEGVTGEQLVIPHSAGEGAEGNYLTQVFLPALTSGIIGLAGGLAVLFIIVGAIQILTAYGNDEKIANAKKTIIYAVVGLIIALLSYAIVSIIGGIQVTQTRTEYDEALEAQQQGQEQAESTPDATEGQETSETPE